MADPSAWRRLTAAIASLATLAVLAGCGDDDPAGDSPDDGPVAVKLAETPGIPRYFADFGVQKGFFEDEGIDLEVMTLPGGSQQATAAIAGDVQFIGGDGVSFNTFRTRDLPLTIVRPGTAASATPEKDFSTVQVAGDSPIQDVSDLAGATIAVNELNNIGTITISGVLEKEGVDPDDVTFAELSFPDMLPALESGSIDAAWLIEPFSTIGLQQGNRSIMSPYAQYEPSLQIGLVLTTKKYAEQNADVVEAFQRAHRRTGEYITENPDEFRDALVKLGDFDAAMVAEMKLPVYNTELDDTFLERLAESMVDAGLIDEVPSYEGSIEDGA